VLGGIGVVFCQQLTIHAYRDIFTHKPHNIVSEAIIKLLKEKPAKNSCSSTIYYSNSFYIQYL